MNNYNHKSKEIFFVADILARNCLSSEPPGTKATHPDWHEHNRDKYRWKQLYSPPTFFSGQNSSSNCNSILVTLSCVTSGYTTIMALEGNNKESETLWICSCCWNRMQLSSLIVFFIFIFFNLLFIQSAPMAVKCCDGRLWASVKQLVFMQNPVSSERTCATTGSALKRSWSGTTGNWHGSWRTKIWKN